MLLVLTSPLLFIWALSCFLAKSSWRFVNFAYLLKVPALARYRFFSSAYGIFSSINHILGHKTGLDKFKSIEIISRIFSNHKGMKQEINHRKRNEKKTITWRLNNMLLKKPMDQSESHIRLFATPQTIRSIEPTDYMVHRILQPRILECVDYPFSSRSSWPKNWTRVYCIAARFFTNWAMREWGNQKGNRKTKQNWQAVGHTHQERIENPSK